MFLVFSVFTIDMYVQYVCRYEQFLKYAFYHHGKKTIVVLLQNKLQQQTHTHTLLSTTSPFIHIKTLFYLVSPPSTATVIDNMVKSEKLVLLGHGREIHTHIHTCMKIDNMLKLHLLLFFCIFCLCPLIDDTHVSQSPTLQ